MKQGGRLGIAVPDGLNTDQQYINYVKPDGIGPGADDYKVLFNYIQLSDIVHKYQLHSQLVEYWNEEKELISEDTLDKEGYIQRTSKNLGITKSNEFGFLYSSLVIDAIKI